MRLSFYLTLSCAIAGQVNLPSQFDKPPDMKDLMNEVAAKAKGCWEQVAIQLNLSSSDVDSIQKEKMGNAIGCYTEVFKVWQRRGSPPYTWATIINALSAPAVEQEGLANELKVWLLNKSQWETNFD